MASIIDAIKILISGDGSNFREDVVKDKAEVESLRQKLEEPVMTPGINEAGNRIVMTRQELEKAVDTSNWKTANGKVVESSQLTTSDLKRMYAEQRNAANETAETVKIDSADIVIANETAKKSFNYEKAGSGLQQLGFLAAGAAAGLGAIGYESVKADGDFQEAMRNVNSMAHMSEDQFKSLENQVLELSKDPQIRQTPVQLAQGLYDIVSAGYNAKDGLEVLEASAKGADAGLTDTKTSSNALTSALLAYGAPVSQATDYMDTMFTAVKDGKLDFQQLSQNIGMTVGVASAAHVPFDQVAAAMAAMTNKGYDAAESATAITRIITSFLKPSKQASEEAQKFGVNLSEAELKSKGLMGAIQELSSKVGDNDEALMKITGDARATRAAFALAGDGGKAYSAIMADMANRTGQTSAALAEQMKSPTYAWQEFKKEAQQTGITVGQYLMPTLLQLLQSIQGLLGWFQQLSPHTQEMITKFLLFGTIGLGAVAVFGLISGSILQSIEGFKALGAGIKLATGLFFKWGEIPAIMGRVKTAMVEMAGAERLVAIGEALMNALNPVGWIMLVVVAIGALAVAVYKNWGSIGPWLSQEWTKIKTMAEQVWGAITAFFKKWGLDILAALLGPLGILALEIYKHWDQIKTAAIQAWNTITTGVVSIVQGFINGVISLWNNFVSFLKSLAQGLVNGIVAAFQWLYNHNYYFKDLVDGIVAWWNWFVNTTTQIWNNIKNFLQALWQDIVKIATIIWTALSQWFKDFWNSEVQAWTSIWNDIKQMLTDLWKALVSIGIAIWTPIEAFFKSLWESISNTASSVWNTIKTTLSGLWHALITDAETIFNSLGDYFKDLWNQALQWGYNIVHMIAQGIKNAAHEVMEAAKSVAHGISSFLGFHSPTEEGPGSDADTWMPNMMNMFIAGIKKQTPGLQAALAAAIMPPEYMVSGSVAGMMGMNGVVQHTGTIYHQHDGEVDMGLPDKKTMKFIQEQIWNDLYRRLRG